jgi:hypothetical protein
MGGEARISLGVDVGNGLEKQKPNDNKYNSYIT